MEIPGKATFGVRSCSSPLLSAITRGRAAKAGFFGSKRWYTAYINMPNLTSGSGSWVLRFAELENDGAEPAKDGEISSPGTVKKADPHPSALRNREPVETAEADVRDRAPGRQQSRRIACTIRL